MTARPTDAELSGMTINQRLVACGLFDRWDAAAKARRREEMIEILCRVALTEKQAAWSVDSILANPAKHGF